MRGGVWGGRGGSKQRRRQRRRGGEARMRDSSTAARASSPPAAAAAAATSVYSTFPESQLSSSPLQPTPSSTSCVSHGSDLVEVRGAERRPKSHKDLLERLHHGQVSSSLHPPLSSQASPQLLQSFFSTPPTPPPPHLLFSSLQIPLSESRSSCAFVRTVLYCVCESEGDMLQLLSDSLRSV